MRGIIKSIFRAGKGKQTKEIQRETFCTDLLSAGNQEEGQHLSYIYVAVIKERRIREGHGRGQDGCRGAHFVLVAYSWDISPVRTDCVLWCQVLFKQWPWQTCVAPLISAPSVIVKNNNSSNTHKWRTCPLTYTLSIDVLAANL